MPMFPLANERALLTIAGVALIVHFVFKRYEPHRLTVHALLLLATPSLLVLPLLDHLPATKAVPVALVTFWITLICSVALYRLSPWHPLARYPGPLLLRLSKLRMAWISRAGRRHIYTQGLHRRYGDIVRVGPNEVSINNPAAIQAFMGTSGLHKGPQWHARTATQSVQPLIAISDPKEHLRRRKPWNRALNVASLKDLEPFVAARAEQLVSRLAASQSQNPSSKPPTNLAKWFSWFAYDLMSDMAFGGGSEMLLNGDEGSVWSLLEVGLVNSDTFGHLPWMADYIRTFPGLGAKMKEMRSFCIQRTLERVKLGNTSRKDLFYYLNNEDGFEHPRPLPEVVADGTLAIVAGSDTTSSVLSNIFYCLLTHPEAYTRLRAEVDSYYPSGEDALNTKHHANMPYLNAVINEAMRLFPPVSDGSQRVVPIGSGGKILEDSYLPEGTITTVHMYSIHRDSRNFSPLPDSFWPERWIHAAADDKSVIGMKLVHNTAAFFPFSFGPGNCPGKGLAMQELRMVVSGIIQRVDLSLDNSFDPVAYENGLLDYFILTRPPLPVIVRQREHKQTTLQ
ncbi:high nitrogen upregulated cytochrome P450 monooxygenase 2 [Dichomitus squalens]|uniref:High nitrogen upregulated cytochrome P450 monooxygenase 2 n=1 Tax=Dichomitus squalens TaxID=114155 RepID=A0A4Q9Q609_9APHY|nr:high nitrogen upregulated cytochrome P450 monooxygenase 2 [Dichomitus squalens LYAD-421 SS1]EJF67274.1 high nitrogen upregulated cytochrome P450 monooxygenase 2 [Dichomitus squalens LYAD-421 SS1]TBU29821.1 high nitrogen upregulated cytochrome P450 monooxygenase 2 [Dichomitus squalens]TBU40014.1 high nitrogen upregulated cytochrome P450 monooxygenase 2 [Dichomitus squalens]TBU62560.1 high nitrogen upregulated cytochrome P450 monooxygenase 2 [Dichomitus squalens]